MDPLHLELKLGEQLTGLSPTVCRRAIAAVHAWLATAQEHSGYVDEPNHIRACISLLAAQTNIRDHYQHTMHGRSTVKQYLDACETFLDIVEGKEPPATEPSASPKK